MVGGSLRQVRGPGPRIVLLGMVIQAVAFIAWTDQLLDVSYVMGKTLVDPLWVVGLLAIGAGGVLAGRRPEPPVDTDEMSRRGGILPAATFVALIAALVHAGFEDPPLGAQLTLAAGALVCGGTMIVRTMLLERRLGSLLSFEREAREELAGREAELARLNERLREDSRRDPLTGLRNRRALVEDLPDVELDARRRGQSIAMAICDVDRFKAYNDKLGHIAGDQALRAIAATVRMQLRAGDAAYRYGGEELVLVLRDANEREALAAAERVRAAVESAALPHPADPRGVVTVSIGVAAGEGDAPALLSHADRALYEAKHGGRNGVRAAAGAAAKAPARRRTDAVEQPLLRHLRGLLEISRAAASGRGPMPVVESMAELIQTELHFHTVSVNLREGHDDDLRVVLVAGDEDARGALLGKVNPWVDVAPAARPRARSPRRLVAAGRLLRLVRRPQHLHARVGALARARRLGPGRRPAAPAARRHRRGARHGLRRRAADRPPPDGRRGARADGRRRAHRARARARAGRRRGGRHGERRGPRAAARRRDAARRDARPPRRGHGRALAHGRRLRARHRGRARARRRPRRPPAGRRACCTTSASSASPTRSCTRPARSPARSGRR